MAALIRHGNVGTSIFAKTPITALFTVPVRHKPKGNKVRGRNGIKRKKPKQKPDYKSKWEWNENSLSSRGFLRSLKSYTPPENVDGKLVRICKKEGISTENSTSIDDLEKRFEFFSICAKEFDYFIPNSMLCKMETVGDVKQFYQTPINTNSPMDDIKKMQLPKNLHILYEYHRFHPDTDTKFDGKTAFPKASTLVTGLRAKKKYPSVYRENPYQQF